MKDKYYIKLKNDFGTFTLIEGENNYITGIYVTEVDVSNLINKRTPLLEELERQLKLYFSGELKQFNIKTKQKLTPFQKKVYDVLNEVPYGYTLTYSDIAYLIDNEKGSRAVGNALGRNNILLIMPCHRVLGKNSLGGFSSGVELKKKLLTLEGVFKDEEI